MRPQFSREMVSDCRYISINTHFPLAVFGLED